MATLTKTITLTSPAGGSSGILSDALSITMSKAVTVAGANTMKKVTAIHTGEGTEIIPVSGRSICYIRNNGTSAANNLSIFSDSLTAGDTLDGSVSAGDGTVDAYELIMEINFGEFALFPAASDFAIRAKAASASTVVEVGIFSIA
tara:strand:+ start:455 stop:892 length:438 start_codon:yes stop_codon:yes gene_type:complete